MTKFQKGQRVHVEFDGVVFSQLGAPGGVYVKVGSELVRYVAPGGEEYFVRPHRYLCGEIVFHCFGREDFVGSPDSFKDSNPRLVRRRGQR